MDFLFLSHEKKQIFETSLLIKNFNLIFELPQNCRKRGIIRSNVSHEHMLPPPNPR